MKQFVVYIITLLLMMPPPALHKDSIVYDQNVKAHLEKAHENFHHKNDTEQDKTKKHHHHCSVELSVLTVDLPIKIKFTTIIAFRDCFTRSSFAMTCEKPSLRGTKQSPTLNFQQKKE